MNYAKLTFVHPIAGKTTCDGKKLAIRWIEGTPLKARQVLLTKLKLKLFELPRKGKGALSTAKVNNTDAIWWAEHKTRQAISKDTLIGLEKSEHVRWIAPVYRGERSAKNIEGMFTVDPTRLYVTDTVPPESALTKSADLGFTVAVDEKRTARIRGLVALDIGDVSLPGNKGAVQAAQQLTKALSGPPDFDADRAFRFENIPLISPTCQLPTCIPTGVEFLPNDPEFANEWGMQRISAPHAWGVTRGNPDIVIAVIDEGVQLNHPDLNVHPQSWNATTDTPDGSPVGNHGTACAGIVAARINNALGVAGVAGNCRVMAIATSTWADIDIAEGLYFAADNGARVVSMSFGVYPSWGFWDFDIIRDALQHAYDRGLVLVAASGNENISESRFPGSDARTICVGGTNRDDLRKSIGDASIESWWGACYGDDLDVAAPCLEIPTTDRLGTAGYDPSDYYRRFNGTSSATPHVAGLAALLLSIRPDMGNETVREIIETTADKISPSSYSYAHAAHKPNGTWNEEVGYGRINAERALMMACQLPGETVDPTCQKPSVKLPGIPAECIGPTAPPWGVCDQCLHWYETQYAGEKYLQIRIIYDHCLKLLGRMQGPLLYSTTLLPGEKVRLYHYDRYRRIRSEKQRFSVHASLRQTVSALWQARITRSESKYQKILVDIRNDDDATLSIGGELFPVGWNIEDPEMDLSYLLDASIRSVSDQFQQVIRTASQQIEAERSIVVSVYEEAEARDVTSRTLENTNKCRAVTYHVRRIFECYELSTRVAEISWRYYDPDRRGFRSWHSIDDLDELPRDYQKLIYVLLRRLPKVGEVVVDPRHLSVPTDGTLYQAELANCSSCEPAKIAEIQIDLERAKHESRKSCLEAELLSLEVQRRRALLERGSLESFGESGEESASLPSPAPDDAPPALTTPNET